MNTSFLLFFLSWKVVGVARKEMEREGERLAERNSTFNKDKGTPLLVAVELAFLILF